VFDPRVGFSGTADRMDLLPIASNPTAAVNNEIRVLVLMLTMTNHVNLSLHLCLRWTRDIDSMATLHRFPTFYFFFPRRDETMLRVLR